MGNISLPTWPRNFPRAWQQDRGTFQGQRSGYHAADILTGGESKPSSANLVNLQRSYFV